MEACEAVAGDKGSPANLRMPLTGLLGAVIGQAKADRVVAVELKQYRLTVKLARNRETRSSTPEGASLDALTDPDPRQSRR